MTSSAWRDGVINFLGTLLMIDTVSLMIVSAMLGVCLGIWIQKKTMHNIMRCKTIDGTAEHIGNGEFVYIMKSQDYLRIVLGIEDNGALRLSNEQDKNNG
jgi:hypothetical protein